MTCSNTNLLVNGDFRRGIPPWAGNNIKWVNNPIRQNDYSVLMVGQGHPKISVLQQTVQGPFTSECAYYLYFRVLNQMSTAKPVTLHATVAYLNRNRQIIASTPVIVQPPKEAIRHWFSYFTIVPPPSRGTHYANVTFLLIEGRLDVDYIRFAAHSIEKEKTV